MKVFALSSPEDKISRRAVDEAGMTVLPPGSVLVVTRSGILAHTLPVAVTQLATTINQDIKAVCPIPGFDQRYIAYALRSREQEILHECTKEGTTVASVETNRLEQYPLPFAPAAEQRRIADKLDALLARVDACRARLNRVPAVVRRFRQSVLAAATSGELTEDWRQSCGTLRSAEDRVNEVQSGKSGQLRVRAVDPTMGKLDLYELPERWAWVKNHCLAADSPNSICAGPFGTIFKAKDFRSAGIPIVFLRHVGEGCYIRHKPGYMDPSVWRDLHQPYSVFGGELLVAKLGDPPGTACIYPMNIGTAMVTPDVMKMEVDERVALAHYLMYFFNSQNCKRLIEELAFGVTRLRIDLAMFKAFPIPLPPPEEQQEIVHRVEALFAYADRLEAQYATVRGHAERLTPSVLAKAFRGELVPQDPHDEPAGILLRRIAVARNGGPGPSGTLPSRPPAPPSKGGPGSSPVRRRANRTAAAHEARRRKRCTGEK